MRLVCFGHSGDPGGAERSLYELVRDCIERHNADVLVVVPSYGPLTDAFISCGAQVEVMDLPWMRATASEGIDACGSSARARLDAGMDVLLRDAIDRLEAFRPDLILTQTVVIPWGAYAAVWLDVPHVWNIREFGDMDHGLLELMPGIVDDAFIKLMSDQVFFCSQQVADYWHSRIDRHGTVLYAIPLLSGESVSHAEETGRGADPLRVVQVGSLAEGKDPENLLRACKAFSDNGLDIRIGFIGDGPLRDHLEELGSQLGISEQIVFHGWAEDPTSLIAAYDVIVSSSRFEGYGRTLLEGASLGLVPVFPDTPNWRETFQAGTNGLEYTAGDPESLARAFEQLATPDARRRFSVAARDLALRDFGHENPAGVFLRAVEPLMRWEPSRDEANLRLVLRSMLVAIREGLHIRQAERVEFRCTLREEERSTAAERQRVIDNQVALEAERRRVIDIQVALEAVELEVLHIRETRSWRYTRWLRRIGR